MTPASSQRTDWRAVVVAAVGLVIALSYVGRSLAGSDWDPTLFTAFGEEAQPSREYAEQRLGDVMLRPQQGHDGKFFFIQANDPLLLDPAEHAALLDRPLYRSQRMLYPLLAGGFGLFGPEQIVWAMIAVNVVFLAVGTWATAVVARQLGGSAWWGLAFALNFGLISEIAIGGGGVVGAALVLCAVAALGAERHALGVVALSGAVLAREALLVCVAGIAFSLWKDRRHRLAALYASVPVGVVLLWAVYLRLRLGWASGVSEVQEVGWPFVGFLEAWATWATDPVDMLAGVVVLAVAVVFVVRAVRSDHPLGWAALGFAPLAIVFTKQVWLNYFDISRAVALMFTAFVVLAFASRRSRTQAGASGT